MPYSTGRCCEGENYAAPDQELRDEHKCPTYKKSGHTLCGKFDFDTNRLYCKRFEPPPLAVKVGVTSNDVPDTENPLEIVGTANIQFNEEFTTVTDVTDPDNVKLITKDYFLLENN